MAPVLCGPVGGDHRRCRFVAADEDLEQVLGGAGPQPLHAEVLEDQQIDLGESLDELACARGGSASAKSWARSKRAADEHAVPGADRADGDRDGDVALADAGRPDQQDVVMSAMKRAVARSTSLAAGSWD